MGFLFDEPEAPDYSKAIEAAKFKPYSVTTGFGTSNFDTNAGTAGYTLDPRLAAFRDTFYGGAQGMAPSQEQIDYTNRLSNYGINLFDRAANLDTNQIAQDYYNQQQSILNPMRMQENTQLADTLFKTGRTGAGVGMTNTAGQTGYINPEQFTLLSAREDQNAQLALGATDRARQMQADDLTKALGYYGMAETLKTTPYNNMSTLFGYGTGVERLGLTPLEAGLNIGNAATSAGARQGQLLAGQEDARVAAENTPTMFESLVSSALSTGVNAATGAFGKSLFGSSTFSPYTSTSNFESRMGLPQTGYGRYY